ncbi:hypothetical protein Tsubulata_004049 [Turnera subulata]|uniref:Phytocyanin domain-containing protein n=1 Tax=Turnera subulata TaxID=218843 RepID=A0A9Q0F7D1_9ROSI|nr:hypothetical protein Tsubulata_004049 [Turnera subulata]
MTMHRCRALGESETHNNMEGSARKSVIVRLMATIAVVMMMVGSAAGDRRKIGASGWIPNYNYTDWLITSQARFYVDDWLYFVYDERYYNVLEVNKTNYESCNDQGFIKNITRGGRDVFQVKEAKTYYFLSSGGYCWNGMKVAINVEEETAAPAPAPSKNGSPSSTGRQIILPLAVFAVLVWSFLL